MSEIPIDCRASRGRTETERLGGQKAKSRTELVLVRGKRVEGKEFLSALAFAASFFANAIFRANEVGAPPYFL
ncbi:hypothetical protein COT63_00490 [Candidatus Shapirobacteria bacterium CG09_land_8_20_14_0_10_38_17]|uniref:Uncharacterized protein n=1 Tax=Candidatus Shapirobacteria bacterium CG09_land_8_20_14_0_10_38_17 TaxID=1974884 RepID=A0A2H0WRT5_9BACT|nr:MAG: hypothetical protein COT63_00490 [Candidatus Shapirobacteria bacterium CG09_land_8_20_14_0_10_38_17]